MPTWSASAPTDQDAEPEADDAAGDLGEGVVDVVGGGFDRREGFGLIGNGAEVGGGGRALTPVVDLGLAGCGLRDEVGGGAPRGPRPAAPARRRRCGGRAVTRPATRRPGRPRTVTAAVTVRGRPPAYACLLVVHRAGGRPPPREGGRPVLSGPGSDVPR